MESGKLKKKGACLLREAFRYDHMFLKTALEAAVWLVTAFEGTLTLTSLWECMLSPINMIIYCIY